MDRKKTVTAKQIRGLDDDKLHEYYIYVQETILILVSPIG